MVNVGRTRWHEVERLTPCRWCGKSAKFRRCSTRHDDVTECVSCGADQSALLVGAHGGPCGVRAIWLNPDGSVYFDTVAPDGEKVTRLVVQGVQVELSGDFAGGQKHSKSDKES